MREGVTLVLPSTMLWLKPVVSSKVVESRLKKRLSVTLLARSCDQFGVELTFQTLEMFPTQVLSAPEPVMLRLRMVSPVMNCGVKVRREPEPPLIVGVTVCVIALAVVIRV